MRAISANKYLHKNFQSISNFFLANERFNSNSQLSRESLLIVGLRKKKKENYVAESFAGETFASGTN